MLTRRTLVGGALACFAASTVAAQEHEHGVGDIPDWYDKNFCCNMQDCKPIKDPDNDLMFFYYRADTIWGPYVEGLSEPAYLYKLWGPDGIIFKKESFRGSLDGRFHRCIYVPAYEDEEGVELPGEAQPRCLYIPGSV